MVLSPKKDEKEKVFSSKATKRRKKRKKFALLLDFLCEPAIILMNVQKPCSKSQENEEGARCYEQESRHLLD